MGRAAQQSFSTDRNKKKKKKMMMMINKRRHATPRNAIEPWDATPR
jgi:hypothetical protein